MTENEDSARAARLSLQTPVERAAFELYLDQRNHGAGADTPSVDSWPHLHDDERAFWTAKAARVLRAAGVDPDLLRWCSWPDCLASYDASSGPHDRGWKSFRHMAVLLCPEHSPTSHWPSFDMDRDDLTYLTAKCGCGETAEVSPANWDA